MHQIKMFIYQKIKKIIAKFFLLCYKGTLLLLDLFMFIKLKSYMILFFVVGD